MKPKWSKYIPHNPFPKQRAFLWLTCDDALYGGAAGGGKSDALLMAALQYVEIPGYNALLVRDTFENLTKPEGLLNRAHEWLQHTDARWVNNAKEGSKCYKFPSGAALWFTYLDGPLDHFNHQSAAYQFVGIDEVANIRKYQALYLFSRMRRRKPESYKDDLMRIRKCSRQQAEYYYRLYLKIPLRFRCASNPPAFEQLAKGAWVKERYVDKETKKPDKVYIPATMYDNPHIEIEEYRRMLSNLDPITRRQLEEGDWDVSAQDRFFETNLIDLIDISEFPRERAHNFVRRWDLAATEDKKKSRDESDSGPAFTCGTKGALVDGILYVLDIKRKRLLPGPANQFIRNTAIGDGVHVQQIAEQEPGSSGKRDMWNLSNVLLGYSFTGKPSTGSKIVRARPLASAISMAKVKFVKGPWNSDALKELMLFPDGKFKDIVDSMSGLYSDLTGAGGSIEVSAPDNDLNRGHRELREIYD